MDSVPSVTSVADGSTRVPTKYLRVLPRSLEQPFPPDAGRVDLYRSAMRSQPPGYVVPSWWPGLCLAFDALLGGFLVLRLMRHPNLPLNVDA